MEFRYRDDGRRRPRAPQPISDVVARLMSRKGYARMQGASQLEQSWKEICGELSRSCRCGSVRHGTLEVIVENSVVLQELSLRKAEIIDRLRELAPEEGIRNLRLRIGAIR